MSRVKPFKFDPTTLVLAAIVQEVFLPGAAPDLTLTKTAELLGHLDTAGFHVVLTRKRRETAVCQNCGAAFLKRRQSPFCSPKCRMAASRKSKAEAA